MERGAPTVMYRNEEHRKSLIQAYLRERAGYVTAGLPARVEEVDRIMARLGYDGVVPVEPAERRPCWRGEQRG